MTKPDHKPSEVHPHISDPEKKRIIWEDGQERGVEVVFNTEDPGVPKRPVWARAALEAAEQSAPDPAIRRAIAEKRINTPPSRDEGVRIHAARLAGLLALPDRTVIVDLSKYALDKGDK